MLDAYESRLLTTKRFDRACTCLTRACAHDKTQLELLSNIEEKTEICSGSEEGSYLRLIDFVYHTNSRLESNKGEEEEENDAETNEFRKNELRRIAGCRHRRGAQEPVLSAQRRQPSSCRQGAIYKTVKSVWHIYKTVNGS